MLRRLERRLGQVARRKGLTILLVGLAPLALRLLLLPWISVPNPRIHDEFSYLLMTDTFAHGRLVNPVHPMWVHFESMHILVRPVYASVFPAAQGVVMAAGKVLTGYPWAGVWLSVGIMCAALCWMLQGWVSPGWALLGGTLAAMRFGVFSYWMNSYYGGAIAAAGGALVLGAFPRVFRRRNWRDAALMGVGLAVLANSRPYEGFVFSVPILAAVIWRLRNRSGAVTVLVPLILVLTLAAVVTGFYFARFSGNPFLLPYSLYRNTFTMAPHFIWQSPRPEPVYHHRVLRYFYTGWEMGAYRDARANLAPRGLLDKAVSYWRFCLGPFLTVPLLTLPWLWKRRRMRLLLLTGILFCFALAVEVWNAPHYGAPAMGLVMLLVVEGLRQLRQMGGGLRGIWLVRGVVVACILSPVIGGGTRVSDSHERADILKQLESMEGRHLVLARYRLTHDTGNEWVYNSADIDNARVVWAREMDPTSNSELARYFQGRRVWLVQPDVSPTVLSPYDPSQPPDPPFAFVKLGVEAISALRSPQEIRRKILRKAEDEYRPPFHFTCDQWNYFFQQVTGVQAPDSAQGCFTPGNRGQPLTFDSWFGWLEKQR